MPEYGWVSRSSFICEIISLAGCKNSSACKVTNGKLSLFPFSFQRRQQSLIARFQRRNPDNRLKFEIRFLPKTPYNDFSLSAWFHLHNKFSSSRLGLSESQQIEKLWRVDSFPHGRKIQQIPPWNRSCESAESALQIAETASDPLGEIQLQSEVCFLYSPGGAVVQRSKKL